MGLKRPNGPKRKNIKAQKTTKYNFPLPSLEALNGILFNLGKN